jgi:hypothetical protein
MYGLINQSIQGLLTDNYGIETWEIIKKKAAVNEEYFLSNKIYDDKVTFDLVHAASDFLTVDADTILRLFGKYWVLKIAVEKYGKLMDFAGSNIHEFMKQLPNFHSRVMLLYPEITPPEFIINKIDDNSYQMHYYSIRIGLGSFMIGLIDGISDYYDTPCSVEVIDSEITDISHIVYRITVK